MTDRRWELDERGRGIGSGDAFSRNVADLAQLMADPAWVAEEPEMHLLPHLEAACAEPGSILTLDEAWSDDGVFVVELTSTKRDASIGELRRAAVELAASIAEESTHVLQRRNGDALEFEIATGTSGEGRFAPHGHLVRLRIRSPA